MADYLTKWQMTNDTLCFRFIIRIQLSYARQIRQRVERKPLRKWPISLLDIEYHAEPGSRK